MVTKSEIQHGLDIINDLIDNFELYTPQNLLSKQGKRNSVRALQLYRNELQKGKNPTKILFNKNKINRDRTGE